MTRLAIVFSVIAACLLAAPPARADAPYAILRGPTHQRFAPTQRYCAPSYDVAPTPYAYGWFGAQTRHFHRSRSHGYHNRYTQWSFR